MAARKPRSTRVTPPTPAPTEPAPATDVDNPDHYTRCAGHVLTERGWVPEVLHRKEA